MDILTAAKQKNTFWTSLHWGPESRDINTNNLNACTFILLQRASSYLLSCFFDWFVLFLFWKRLEGSNCEAAAGQKQILQNKSNWPKAKEKPVACPVSIAVNESPTVWQRRYGGQFLKQCVGLEGLPVNGTCFVFVVFPFRHPHLFKGVQRCQDRATDPCRVKPLLWSRDLNLYIFRCELLHFC